MNWYEFFDAAIIAGFVIAVARKYGSLLNPVSFFGAFFFLCSIVEPELFRLSGLLDVSPHALDLALVANSLYFGAFGLAYTSRSSPLRWVFGLLRKLSRPFSMQGRRETPSVFLPLLMVEWLSIFASLMILSGAGLLWLTDPRSAYQFHRTGVGVIWALASATLFLAYFVWIVRYGESAFRVFSASLVFALLAMFLGSKGTSLAFPFIGMFYVHYHIRRISSVAIVGSAAALLLLVAALQILQGTAGSLASAALYFDYFINSAKYIDLGRPLQYGHFTLSSLWEYVPRALYPDKPYAYGSSLLTDWIFPGSAARGDTPGIINWTVSYADFGLPGVIVNGLLTAWISKAVFESFITEKSIDVFALMAQLGFIYGVEMFPNAPFPIFWLWFMMQSSLFWLIKQASKVDSQRSAVVGTFSTS